MAHRGGQKDRWYRMGGVYFEPRGMYNGLKKLDTDLAENRWKDMIKYDQKNATRKSASCVSGH